MRYSTLSGFAVLAASLLVKDVIASPISLKNGQLMKREGVKVVVTHEVVVSFKDGKWTTGIAKAVKTVTEGLSAPAPSPPVVQPVVQPVAQPVAQPVVQPVVAAKVEVPAEEKPKPAATSTPPPPTYEAPKVETPPKVDTPPKTDIQTSGNKEGLAYNDGKTIPSSIGGSKASWAWNWASSTKNVPEGCEFVPMLWGTKKGEPDSWAKNAAAAIASGSKHLLSFNEPDHKGQAYLSPGEAASAYKQYMNQFAGKAKLGSPGVTNGQAKDGMGLGWMKDFLGQCSDCTIDFINFHFYWDDASASADFVLARLKEHVEEMKKLANGKPLWLTEIKFLGGEKQKFNEAAVKYMEANVERYSFFGFDY